MNGGGGGGGGLPPPQKKNLRLQVVIFTSFEMGKKGGGFIISADKIRSRPP